MTAELTTDYRANIPNLIAYIRSTGVDIPRLMRELHAATTPTPPLVENVEWLTANGCSPHEITQRVNRSPSTIAQALYRAGRLDLARAYWSLDDKRKRAARRTP